MILGRPVAMKKVGLYMLDTDAQQAAMTLARMQVLHPVDDQQKNREMDQLPAGVYYDIFNSLRNHYAKLGGVPQSVVAVEDSTAIVTLPELQLMDVQLKHLWTIVSALDEQLRHQHEEFSTREQLAKSLQKFISLDLDLSRFRRPGRFLKIIVGTVPSANFAQLQRALTLAEFMIESFFAGEGIQHVVVIGSSLQQRDVQDLLKSADFREIDIPAEFSGNPSRLQSDLNVQISQVNLSIQRLIKKRTQLLTDIGPILHRAQDLLVRAQPYASLGSVLKGSGGLVYLQGWVPAKQQEHVEHELQRSLKYPFYVQFSEPQISEYNRVPSLLEHSWILKPFQNLVHNYGIPGYAEFDPTLLFSVSYILMFGMMFGDVGHGAFIAISSLFLWKRFKAISIVAVLAGLSSILFGFVYGSLFGYEDVIQPLWMSPMHDPQTILLLALAWGACFLVTANLLAITNFVSTGQHAQALYSAKGLAGLLFYVAALYAGYQFMMQHEFGLIELALLVLPMAVMIVHEWRHTTAGLFERILVVFIQSLEQVISSVSGTLSFLRVAAFTLNHIALAAAVFSIASMMGTTGHWVTVVLGNLFIIVLEGAIVAIQCLRLEYYEGFSRFFSGTGRAFEPLKLGSHSQPTLK